MEFGDDPRLKRLLQEWQVPNAPDAVERRILGHPKRWWRILLTSRVRVPLPVAVVFSVALIWLTVLVVQDRTQTMEPVVTSDDLRGFQPVNSINVRVERSSDATQ